MRKRQRPQRLLKRGLVTTGAPTSTSAPPPPPTQPGYNKCPECGAELEATVPFYLSQVQVDRDGFITDYIPAFDDKDSLNLDEPELVKIYCTNDHPFDLSKAAKAKTKKRARKTK